MQKGREMLTFMFWLIMVGVGAAVVAFYMDAIDELDES
jgi:hypothetical protein